MTELETADLEALRALVRRWMELSGQGAAELAEGAYVGRQWIEGLLAGEAVSLKQAQRLTRAINRAPRGFAGRRARPATPYISGGLGRVEPKARPIGQEDLAARIEADQARLHGPRLALLEAERAKYGLRRRGLLPEEMAA